MLERFIQSVQTEAAPEGTPGATRERLKARFAPGAARRMTLLGMMVGSTLPPDAPSADDAVVYSSVYGESPALEQYLDSFPTPSPTLFQTSIHPSGVQQSLIGRQQAVREFFPLTGSGELPVQAALAALLTPAARVLWSGGDERGSWLRENGAAGDRSFAFTLVLARGRSAQSIGRIAVAPAPEAAGALALPVWFDLLHGRRPWRGAAGTGWTLELEWW